MDLILLVCRAVGHEWELKDDPGLGDYQCSRCKVWAHPSGEADNPYNKWKQK